MFVPLLHILLDSLDIAKEKELVKTAATTAFDISGKYSFSTKRANKALHIAIAMYFKASKFA